MTISQIQLIDHDFPCYMGVVWYLMRGCKNIKFIRTESKHRYRNIRAWKNNTQKQRSEQEENH